MQSRVVAMALVVLTSCMPGGDRPFKGKELTSRGAHTTLSRYLADSLPLNVALFELLIGSSCAELDDGAIPMSRHGGEAQAKTWRLLREDNVITVRDSSWGMSHGCFAELTPSWEARRVAEGWERRLVPSPLGPPSRRMLIPIGTRRVVEITDVAQGPESEEAFVEYRWESAFTPLGRRIAEETRGGSLLTGEGIAVMKRYDDGWRVLLDEHEID